MFRPALGDRGLKCVDHLSRRLEPLPWIPLKGAHEEEVDLGRQTGCDAGRNGHGSSANLHDDVGEPLIDEWQLPRDRAKEDHRHRPEVTAKVEILRLANLLWAHVVDRSNKHSGPRRRACEGAGRLRDAEIEELHHFLVILYREENVPWLEVPVNDAGLMRLAKGLPRLGQNGRCPLCQ